MEGSVCGAIEGARAWLAGRLGQLSRRSARLHIDRSLARLFFSLWGRGARVMRTATLIEDMICLRVNTSGLASGISASARLSEPHLPLPRTNADFTFSLFLLYLLYSTHSTLGPSLGAYFASRPLPISTPSHLSLPFPVLGVSSFKLNSYAFPALVTLVLLSIETIFLWWKLPETKGWSKVEEEETGESKNEEKKVVRTKEQREKRLRELQWVHLGFLFFFSGESSFRFEIRGEEGLGYRGRRQGLTFSLHLITQEPSSL